MARTVRAITSTCAIAALLTLIACKQAPTQAAAPAKRPPVPVTVAKVRQHSIPVEVRAIGNVEPYSTIGVKSLVAGQLVHVYFTEGDYIRKGQQLFQVDPRPFEQALKQAEANLARDAATAANAEADAQRYDELFKQGIVAKSDNDLKQFTKRSMEATLAADRAAIDNARLQLEYCNITSPIEGRTGNVMVKEGNVVKANDVPLVTINQIHPIYVSFSVPEKDFLEINKRMADHLTVRAVPAGGDESHPLQGMLTFADNAVDQTTGTIRLKATFDNTDNRLWPGQFANATLFVTTQPNAILVPSEAVQTGQNGQFVFVVKPDMKVEVRPVVLGRLVGNEQAVTGVQPGEIVITDGQSRLVPGATVQVVQSPQQADGAGL
ncbi:MAG TPA: efflux RND transporter periplasmic adaptor subunit [Bryobacteraceae bacterium]|nr:efflux RND transporter periplasmic adaptor subunit [Bryobacteraceae bacterium]